MILQNGSPQKHSQHVLRTKVLFNMNISRAWLFPAPSGLSIQTLNLIPLQNHCSTPSLLKLVCQIRSPIIYLSLQALWRIMTLLTSSINQATGMRWKAIRHQWCSVLSAILNNMAHLTKQMVFFTVQVLLHSYPRAKFQEKDPVLIKRLLIIACCPSLCGLISREKLHRKRRSYFSHAAGQASISDNTLNTRITGYLAMVILH